MKYYYKEYNSKAGRIHITNLIKELPGGDFEHITFSFITYPRRDADHNQIFSVAHDTISGKRIQKVLKLSPWKETDIEDFIKRKKRMIPLLDKILHF